VPYANNAAFTFQLLCHLLLLIRLVYRPFFS
jgi:hypothetical protein